MGKEYGSAVLQEGSDSRGIVTRNSALSKANKSLRKKQLNHVWGVRGMNGVKRRVRKRRSKPKKDD